MQNALNVAASSSISVVFDQSLNPATVTQASIPVYGISGLVAGSYGVSTTTKTNDTVTFENGLFNVMGTTLDYKSPLLDKSVKEARKTFSNVDFIFVCYSFF